MSQLTVGFAVGSRSACSSQQAALQDMIALDSTIRPVWCTMPPGGQTASADRLAPAEVGTPRTGAPHSLDFSLRPHAWVCDGPAILALSKRVFSRGAPLVLEVNATPRQCQSVIRSVQHPTLSRGRLEALRHWWHGQVFRRAQLVVARSDWAARSLVGHYGIDPRRLVVIPPGLDLAAWRPVPSRTSPPVIRVLCVAEHITETVTTSLRVCLASTDLTGRCEFHIVTRDTLPPELAGVVRRDWVRERESPTLYGGADIFVLLAPSQEFPGTVVKAMAAGLPVVAERLKVLEETVEDGYSGFLVPRHDGRALSQALDTLTNDTTTREQMGQRGRVLAETKFDADKNSRRLLAAIKAIIAHARGDGGGSDPIDLYL